MCGPYRTILRQENAVQVTGVDVDVEVGNVGGTIVIYLVLDLVMIPVL